MKALTKGLLPAGMALALSLGTSFAGPQQPQTEPDSTTRQRPQAERTTDSQKAPDNSGRNKRDRGDGTMTADKQSEHKSDRELTRHIRSELMKEKDLSTYAHNAKIVVRDGAVTLRGPVRSDEEKTRIAAIAERLAGAGKVTNELEVSPSK